jgi:hypothetical protein
MQPDAVSTRQPPHLTPALAEEIVAARADLATSQVSFSGFRKALTQQVLDELSCERRRARGLAPIRISRERTIDVVERRGDQLIVAFVGGSATEVDIESLREPWKAIRLGQ